MKKTYSNNQLRDYSTLFLRSEVNRIMRNDFNSFNAKIARYQKELTFKNDTYLSYLKKVYKVLEKHYPNEYIYKNEFLNKWLINELGSNNNSIVFNELRLGKVIADLAMFNGVSKVFEIKTTLDKDCRLNDQIDGYQKIFNEIYIIVPVSKLDKYLEYNNVGVISYENDAQEFRLIRKSPRNFNIDSDSLMQVLHTKEYLKIVKQYFNIVPECSDFEKFEVCKNLISKIPLDILNQLFIEVMKKRKVNNEFSSKGTRELNQLCLSLNLNDSAKEYLIQKLKSPIIL